MDTLMKDANAYVQFISMMPLNKLFHNKPCTMYKQDALMEVFPLETPTTTSMYGPKIQVWLGMNIL